MKDTTVKVHECEKCKYTTTEPANLKKDDDGKIKCWHCFSQSIPKSKQKTSEKRD